MKRKKQTLKRRPVAIARPLDKLDKEERVEHYNAILIEGLRSDMKQVIESVDARMGGFERTLMEFRKETKEEFDGVKVILRQHSTEINELRTEMQAMGTEMHAMEGRLSAKIDGHTTRLDDHEGRITSLESAGH